MNEKEEEEIIKDISKIYRRVTVRRNSSSNRSMLELENENSNYDTELTGLDKLANDLGLFLIWKYAEKIK